MAYCYDLEIDSRLSKKLSISIYPCKKMTLANFRCYRMLHAVSWRMGWRVGGWVGESYSDTERWKDLAHV